MTYKLEDVTPRPWTEIYVDGCENGCGVSITFEDEGDFSWRHSNENDRQHILNCVNSHETLLALVEELLERIEHAESKSLDDICECVGAPKEYNKAKSMIRDRFVSSLKESKTKATETLNKIKGEK